LGSYKEENTMEVVGTLGLPGTKSNLIILDDAPQKDIKGKDKVDGIPNHYGLAKNAHS
jgi:hypothetical protein